MFNCLRVCVFVKISVFSVRWSRFLLVKNILFLKVSLICVSADVFGVIIFRVSWFVLMIGIFLLWSIDVMVDLLYVIFFVSFINWMLYFLVLIVC